MFQRFLCAIVGAGVMAGGQWSSSPVQWLGTIVVLIVLVWLILSDLDWEVS